MYLLRRTGVLEKLYKNIKNYSSLISTLHRVTPSGARNYLQRRFLDYLNDFDVSSKNNENTEEPKLHLQDLKLSDINNDASSILPGNDVSYKVLVTSLQSFASKRTFKREIPLSHIDTNCCKLLIRLSKSEILQLLHLFAKVTNVTTTKFYTSALLALQKHLDNDNLDVREMLQFLCFTSMAKKHSRSKVKRLIESLPPLKDLALMDRCVVAHSTFMCSVKLNPIDVLTLEETLEKNASTLIKDPPILVTLCKAVRYRRPSRNFSLTNLSTEIMEEKKRFTTMAAAHILSLYTEADHQNVRVMKKLFDDSMWQLTKERTSPASGLRNRVKDVDRLLWAASRLDYAPSESDKMEITSFIDRSYVEYTENPFAIANTLLSLWILDLKLINVVEDCLARRIFEIADNKLYLWKSVARLQLLLNCVKLEYPEIILPDNCLKRCHIGLKVCKSVFTMYRIVDELKCTLDIESVTIDSPIPEIYIAGVSLRSKTTLIHIDVLSWSNCFVGTNNLTGLAKLKIRLLPKIGYRSILINADRSSDREFISSSIGKMIEDEEK